MDTIELWEQEIALDEKYSVPSLDESDIYNFYDSEPVHESIITGVLIAVGAFIMANIFLVASCLIFAKKAEKQFKQTNEDILKNPKAKKLIEQALEKMEEFVYKNLPKSAQKYFKITNKFDLDANQKHNTQISSYILSLDIDKLVHDTVGDGKYKGVDDLVLAMYKKEDQNANDILKNPDIYVNASENKECTKYEEFIDNMKQFSKELNKKIKKIKSKYSTNIAIDFDDLSSTIQHGMAPGFRVSFSIPSKSISSFTEEELNEIEKVSKVKLS